MPLHPAKLLAPAFALATLAALAACAPQPAPVVYDASQPAPMVERRVFPQVNFDFNSYRIRPDNYQQLDNVAAALNDPALAGMRFEINGHTDVTGRLGYNISLSMLRAASVVEYLGARGVPRERMRPQGFGPLDLLPGYPPRSPMHRRLEVVALR